MKVYIKNPPILSERALLDKGVIIYKEPPYWVYSLPRTGLVLRGLNAYYLRRSISNYITRNAL